MLRVWWLFLLLGCVVFALVCANRCRSLVGVRKPIVPPPVLTMSARKSSVDRRGQSTLQQQKLSDNDDKKNLSVKASSRKKCYDQCSCCRTLLLFLFFLGSGICMTLFIYLVSWLALHPHAHPHPAK